MEEASSSRERAELVAQVSGARRTMARGVLVLASIPIVAAVAAMIVIITPIIPELVAPKIVAAGYAAIAGIAGTRMTLRGASRRSAARKQLAAHDERCQLPAARVVER